MTIAIWLIDDMVELSSVEFVRIVGVSQKNFGFVYFIEVKCFGNEPVIWKDVYDFVVTH